MLEDTVVNQEMSGQMSWRTAERREQCPPSPNAGPPLPHEHPHQTPARASAIDATSINRGGQTSIDITLNAEGLETRTYGVSIVQITSCWGLQ